MKDKDEDEDEDKGYDASVSDNSSDTASADGVSEQQHDDMEEVANSTILGLANHEHHLSKSALKRDADSLAAMMEEDGWKYGDASMSDLEARIQAFGEDVERLHERVYGMKSRLEEEIEKSRERNREMDLWYERNVGAVEMEDGCLDWDVDGMDDKGESEDEETSAS